MGVVFFFINLFLRLLIYNINNMGDNIFFCKRLIWFLKKLEIWLEDLIYVLILEYIEWIILSNFFCIL